MITFLVANWRLVLMALLVAALGIQTARLNVSQANFAKYRAEIEKQVAENKAKAALEQARMAHNATEALSELQTRLDSVRRSYRVLRDSRNTPAVSSLAAAAGSLKTCPGDTGEPNPVASALERVEAGVLEILEGGDAELAKYGQLWKLDQRNAAVP